MSDLARRMSAQVLRLVGVEQSNGSAPDPSLRALKLIVAVSTIAFAVYFFSIALLGPPHPLVARSVFCGGVIWLGYLARAVSVWEAQRAKALLFIALALAGTAAAAYVMSNHERFETRLPFFDQVETTDWIAGLVMLTLIIDLARHLVGMAFVSIILFFLVYAMGGSYFPGLLRHNGIDPTNLFEHLFMSTSGIFGSMTSLALAEVFMFIMLGAFLQYAGGNELFSRIAERATRKTRGGPAKAAVIGSSLFGMISGSGVANVYATGSITIPMMTRAGFKREFSAAVEAVASSQGQIIPPIMGASAFLLAEYTRTSYLDVVQAATVPALLYVLATYLAVHFETRRQNIGIYKGFDHDPDAPGILAYSHLIVPVIILMVMLSMRYTSYFSATVATLSVVGVSLLRSSTRMTPARVFEALTAGIDRIVAIGITLVAAGIVVATLTSTGTTFKLSSMLIELGQGELLLVLLLVAITVIILGMGLPPVGAFLIASVFGGPAIIEFGVDPMSAYMFIFLFGVTSLITPPVCLSSYAAASIAGANFARTGVRGLLIGLPAYVIPFAIVHEPIYLRLFSEGVLNGLFSLASGVVGVACFAAATTGYLLRPTSIPVRLGLGATAFGLLWPTAGSTLWASALLGLILAFEFVMLRREGARTAAE